MARAVHRVRHRERARVGRGLGRLDQGPFLGPRAGGEGWPEAVPAGCQPVSLHLFQQQDPTLLSRFPQAHKSSIRKGWGAVVSSALVQPAECLLHLGVGKKGPGHG